MQTAGVARHSAFVADLKVTMTRPWRVGRVSW